MVVGADGIKLDTIYDIRTGTNNNLLSRKEVSTVCVESKASGSLQLSDDDHMHFVRACKQHSKVVTGTKIPYSLPLYSPITVTGTGFKYARYCVY